MQLGFLGLGKMGQRMVRKLIADGHEVLTWNRTPNAEFSSLKTITELVNALESPRILWLMLPAGSATQNVFDEVITLLQPGDIIIDGGNSHFKDSEQRSVISQQKGIKFLGVGVSGGLLAAENGFPLMVGGDRQAYEKIQPILATLSQPHGGYEYFGKGGTGHFVKMVHNGIEYGMMQAIAEGFGVLEKSSYSFDLPRVANLWQKGTIISSFLIDRAKDMLTKDPALAEFAGPIGENGEATWTIEEAEKEGVTVTVIKDSLQFRRDSTNDKTIQQSFVAKVVSALRFAFGGHEVKK